MNETTKQVASEILNQLGGPKFAVITGSKNFVAYTDGLRMDLAKNKSGANRCHITLTPMDTYTVLFYRLNRTTLARSGRGNPVKEIAEFEDVYNDRLQDIFTSATGLYTNLGTMGR